MKIYTHSTKQTYCRRLRLCMTVVAAPATFFLVGIAVVVVGFVEADAVGAAHPSPAVAEGRSRSVASAEVPLREQIDRLIEQRMHELQPEFDRESVVAADDAELLRRVSLDLIGVIPTANEVRAYLNDDNPEKYARLVDRLLADPRSHHHLAKTLAIAWMERRPQKHVSESDWVGWLERQVRENRPLDDVVRDLLSADGRDPRTRPAATFFLDRNVDKDLLTRDIGRMFLGRDFECAQCHDHPLYPEYLQRHYFGITAFINRTYLFNDRKAKKSYLGEKADGLVSFSSVFTNEKDSTPPRILDLPALVDPKIEKQKQYVTKPTSAAAGVPRYSRRLKLAAAVTADENTAFRLNLANRLWALVMGRGLVEPVDLWHVDNPPSHPMLVQYLGTALHRSGYDLQYFLRELVLSKTYRRGSRVRAGSEPAADELFAISVLRPLTPEQFADSTFQALGLLENARQKILEQKPTKQKSVAAIDAASQWAAVRQQMQKLRAPFVKAFVDGPPSSRFDATAQQALFLKNGVLMATSIAPRGDNLIGELQKLEDSQQVAESAYLAVLSRRPTVEESTAISTAYEELDLHSDAKAKTRFLQDVVWALLTSAEFRLQH